MRVSSPFNILERDSDDSIQYLSVDKDSFNNLKSMLKNPDSELNKKRLMLVTAQILLKNGYFVKKCKMPSVVYVYDSDEHYRLCREFSPENLEYLKYLPKTTKVENNYVIDAQTAGRLDKMANILYNISLNKAILYLFTYFNAFVMSKDNSFGSLYKALCDRQETAKYKPTKEFLDNLCLLSNEYYKARIAITVKEKTHPYISNYALKRMEFFLFLSQNFGYRIPQNLKTGFTSKINSLINTMKSVFLSYSRLKSGESLEDKLIEMKTSRMPYNTTIDSIADDICSTPVSNDSEYFPYMFSAKFLPNLIANMTTIIGYKDKNSDFTNEHKRLIYNLLDRLQPLIQNKANFELFTDYAVKDNYFPLYEIEREEHFSYYYSQYGYFDKISPVNSLCYLNLAELFNQVTESSYPYEFTKQALMIKLSEIMPVISTAFCDYSVF